MSQFISSIRDVKNNYSKFDDWEQRQFDKDAKKSAYEKDNRLSSANSTHTKEKAAVVIRAAELLDKRSEDNCENTEQYNQTLYSIITIPLSILLLKLAGNLNKNKTSSAKPNGGAKSILAFAGAMFASSAAFILWSNKKQKEASRIGRFQAKQRDLKDVRNFVIYTPEQIEAAKILAKNIPDKKDKKGLAATFQKMKEMSQDKVAYKKWLQERINNPEDFQKLLNTEFTPEQIKQGNDDKELIVKVVKDINIKAEEYSENAENVFDTLGAVSFLGSIPLSFWLKKIVDKSAKNAKKSSGQLAQLSTLLVGLGVLFAGTAEQKKASRVGRFVAREQLLNNPNSMIYYSPEELAKYSHVKAQKQKQTFFEKLGSNFKFLSQYGKDKAKYKKYIKTEYAHNEKIHQALAKTEVSVAQLNEAKHLQDKTYVAFDKVDEFSQRYSEDVEAGLEIIKNSLSFVWAGISVAALGAFAYMLKKGKLPMHKVLNGISKLGLDKNSSLREFVDKATKTIGQNRELKKDFSKAIFNSECRNKMLNHPELKKQFEEFITKDAQSFIKIGVKTKKVDGKIDMDSATKALLEYLNTHMKKGKIAMWVRNLSADIIKLFAKTKLENSKIKLPEEVKEKLDIKKYNNYKTLFNTLLVSGVPILGTILTAAYSFNSWLTNIQKKAGKIGVMKAVNELDNPKLFVNQNVLVANEQSNKTQII